ncbi:MAG TPA: hypothetical protein VFG69_09800 [Nannocystaceae bacterium]|nr:hypothetical protein [Nannocystaceae bacterium]
MSLQTRVVGLAALMALRLASGCQVVDDPKHCANRDGDRTCAELYAAGVHCSACERFYNGCVDDEPEPECRVDESESTDSPPEDGESSSEGAPASEGAAVDCDDCQRDDSGRGGAVR